MLRFTRITAGTFSLIAAIHLLRATVFPDIASYLPVWGSIAAAAVLSVLFMLHSAYHRLVPCTTWTDTAGHTLTVAALIIGAATHLYRALVRPDLLLDLPLWPSYLAVPLAGLLAWHNWRKDVIVPKAAAAARKGEAGGASK